MIKIKELMAIDANNLIKKQHDGLRDHVTNKLRMIIDLFEKEDYELIRKHISFSPAGDGMGCDNYFIDFDVADGIHDIEDVISKLIALRKQSSEK